MQSLFANISMQLLKRQLRTTMPVAICELSLVLSMSGCAYFNGDLLWLPSEQKEIVIRSRLPTLWDTEYSFEENNLPFCFKLYGCHEFMHIGHSNGAPDYSKGGNITDGSVLRFSIGIEGQRDNVEFLITNGFFQVISSSISNGHLVRRNGLYSSNKTEIDINERWRESVLGKSVSISIWNYGCSIQLHDIGEYGVVYNYLLSCSDTNCAALLIIDDIKNLRLFHSANL